MQKKIAELKKMSLHENKYIFKLKEKCTHFHT